MAAVRRAALRLPDGTDRDGEEAAALPAHETARAVVAPGR